MNCISLSPEKTGQGEFWHSRFGSFGESQIEHRGKESPMENGLTQGDDTIQSVQSFRRHFYKVKRENMKSQNVQDSITKT